MPFQLSIPDSLNISAGIYASDISYNPANETFYMITTSVANGGNFYVKTTNPREGNLSYPIRLPQVGGIDPSILFDKDGKAYIVKAHPKHGVMSFRINLKESQIYLSLCTHITTPPIRLIISSL